MSGAEELKGKSREELMALLASGIEPGSVSHLRYQSAFHLKIVEDAERSAASLVAAIRDAAAASDTLGRKVFWLNVVLAVATVVGAAAAAWAAFGG